MGFIHLGVGSRSARPDRFEGVAFHDEDISTGVGERVKRWRRAGVRERIGGPAELAARTISGQASNITDESGRAIVKPRDGGVCSGIRGVATARRAKKNCARRVWAHTRGNPIIKHELISNIVNAIRAKDCVRILKSGRSLFMTHCLRAQRVAYKSPFLWVVVCAGCLLVVGCSRPLLSPEDVRTPFDRYDAVRSQFAQQYVEDEFGRLKPNLRARLSPKD